jgi:hypothetical protein
MIEILREAPKKHLERKNDFLMQLNIQWRGQLVGNFPV